MSNTSSIRLACVPFPAPGKPISTIFKPHPSGWVAYGRSACADDANNGLLMHSPRKKAPGVFDHLIYA